MHLVVHSPLVVPVALAAMHGTTDFAYPAPRLAPYVLLLCWPAFVPITPAFLVASAVHFAHDVGVRASCGMHAAFVASAALHRVDEAFVAFAIYFCVVHTPLHYARHLRDWRYPCVATALCAAALACLSHFQCALDAVVLDEWMERLVIAHVLCDEWDRAIRPSRDAPPSGSV